MYSRQASRVSIHGGENSAVESDHRTHSIPDAAVTLFRVYGASIPPKSDVSDWPYCELRSSCHLLAISYLFEALAQRREVLVLQPL
jgi:hypothetical protein